MTGPIEGYTKLARCRCTPSHLDPTVCPAYEPPEVHTLRVVDLSEELAKRLTAGTANYRVVAVNDPDMGPDEKIYDIVKISWDHMAQVFRLEIG